MKLTPEQKESTHSYIMYLIIMGLIFGIIWVVVEGIPGQEELNDFLERQPRGMDLVYIEQNSIEPVVPAYFILETEILGVLIQTRFENDITIKKLVEDIAWCESKYRINTKNPSSTAYGLCQFLDGTWEYVEEKWDMELDRNDFEDQLYACVRLLEEEGVIHWEATKECWSK